MNIANWLTLLRIVLAFVFILFLFLPGLANKLAAAAAFVIAAVTDIYDGYLARKYRMITDAGKFLDPLADKILVLSAFISFVEMRIIPAWMVVVVVLRELLITGIRLMAAKQGTILAAARAGKHKTILQMSSIIVILGFIILREAAAAYIPFWSPALEEKLGRGIYGLMLITIGMTVYSGIHYAVQNRSVLRRL